jgi:hypothetical protein
MDVLPMEWTFYSIEGLLSSRWPRLLHVCLGIGSLN